VCATDQSPQSQRGRRRSNLLSDDEDGAQKWAHLENENGEKQFSSHPRDFFSFAPNLSPEHPINKRGHPEAARLILESSQDKAAHAEQKKANDLRMRKLALAAN
jgi:hypothetical protein